MDVNAIKDLADPLILSHRIQSSVDSVAGQHVNMTSMEILLQAIHDLNPIPTIINLIIILIIALLTYHAVRFVDRMLENYIPKVVDKVEMQLDETAGVVIRRVVSASIYIIGLMLIIFQIPQLHSLATVMLASAGLAGLAIGYAAKDSLANFTSGIFIAIFRPFRVGDWVDFRSDYGVIEDLTLRHTVILTKDYRRIIVPNNIMSNEPIINWTIKEPVITWYVDFDLLQASDIDKAREIILEEARRHPNVLKDRVIKVLVTDSRYAELNLKLHMDIPGRALATDIASDVREAVKKRFEEEGIPPAKREN
jgi:small conductance mechanosensitive channel